VPAVQATGQASPEQGGEAEGARAMDARLLLKRITVCKLRDHDWASIPYPGPEASGRFLRCLRCGKESHGQFFPHLPFPPTVG
jgi:hypothetical protein